MRITFKSVSLKKTNDQYLKSRIRETFKRFSIELIHDQLPLAVPCYDLLPVTELTVGPANAGTSGIPGSLELTGSEYKT